MFISLSLECRFTFFLHSVVTSSCDLKKKRKERILHYPICKISIELQTYFGGLSLDKSFFWDQLHPFVLQLIRTGAAIDTSPTFLPKRVIATFSYYELFKV